MAVSTIDALYNGTSEKLTTSATGIDVTGTVTSDGLTVDGAGTAIDLRSNNNGGTALNTLRFTDTDVTAVNNAEIGKIEFYATDTAAVVASIAGLNADASPDGYLQFKTAEGTTLRSRMVIDNSGDISFYEDTGTTAKFFWDASAESLGIGTSSPSEALDLVGNFISATNKTNNTDKQAVFLSHQYASTSEPEGFMMMETYSGASDNRIDIGGGNSGYNSATSITFNTGANTTTRTGSERMRINSSGKVIIGTEPDDTYSNGWSSTGGVQDSSRDSTAARDHYTFRNANGQVGFIQTSGSATSYNTSSDYRLKENVVDLTGASARVNQLDVKRFNFIADDTNTLVDGFLAHEVATVVPEAITGAKDAVDDDGNPEYQGIDQSKLVPLLTAALQEALTEIASLKTRVEALEA